MDLLLFSSKTAPLPLCHNPRIVRVYPKNTSIKQMPPVGDGDAVILTSCLPVILSVNTHSFLLSTLLRAPQLYENRHAGAWPYGLRYCKKG